MTKLLNWTLISPFDYYAYVHALHSSRAACSVQRRSGHLKKTTYKTKNSACEIHADINLLFEI